jgi:hypothetical protein
LTPAASTRISTSSAAGAGVGPVARRNTSGPPDPAASTNRICAGTGIVDPPISILGPNLDRDPPARQPAANKRKCECGMNAAMQPGIAVTAHLLNAQT